LGGWDGRWWTRGTIWTVVVLAGVVEYYSRILLAV
jgi:hypothetical protein